MLHKKGIEIENGEYLQSLGYTHKFPREYQGIYGDVCDSLEDSNLISTEKDIEVLKDHVYQTCFWSWGELKTTNVPSR